MPRWEFDKARFAEEVLKPVSQGWPPSQNRFRVYLLRDGETDQSLIATALAAVLDELPGFARVWPSEVIQLRSAHGDATAVLTDARRCAEHAKAVREQQQLLADSLRDQLAGAPGFPRAVIVALAAATGGRHTAGDVRRSLAELEAAEREPVPLPQPAEPSRWQQRRKELAAVGAASLWEYLERPGLGGPRTTVDQLNAFAGELAKRTGPVVPTEKSLVAAFLALARSGSLADTLLFEALDDVGLQTQYRFNEVVQRARLLRPRLKALGITLNDQDLAYAVWCRHRHADLLGATAYRAKVKAAEARHDLRRAIELLASVPRLPADESKHLAALRARVTECDQRLAAARELEATDGDAAAKIYLEVMAELADDDAEAGLARCIPPAPRDVKAVVDGTNVAVTWSSTGPQAGGITYHVCRTKGLPPRHHDDGTRLVTGVGTTRLVDADAPGAQPLHYGVFAVRAGVAVSRPAVAPEVLVLREVEALKLEPTADVIHVSWRLPAGASGAEVTRTRLPVGAPPAPLRHVAASGLTDSEVSPGVTYAYCVRVRWRLPDGAVRTTPGRIIEGHCQEAPRPADDLFVTVEGSDLLISWRPPPSGRVEIREGRDDSPVRGTLLAAAELDKVGRPLSGTFLRSSDSVRARPDVMARAKLVAVTVLGDLALVGPSCVVDLRLQTVTNLCALRNGNQVQLTWTWPPGGNEATVLVSSGRPPSGPDDSDAVRHTTSRARYDAVGMHLALDEGVYVFSVCMTAASRTERLHGPLVTVTESVSRLLTYRIRRAGRFAGGRRLLVVEGAVPPLVLRAKARTRPMDRHDGEGVLRHEGGAGGLSLPFEVPTGLGRPLHLRLFSLDEAVVLRPHDPDEVVIR